MRLFFRRHMNTVIWLMMVWNFAWALVAAYQNKPINIAVHVFLGGWMGYFMVTRDQEPKA